MSRDAPWPWSELELDGPVPLRDVKRAYAVQLKKIDRNDPDTFQNLEAAFREAKTQAAPAKAPARASLADLVGRGDAPTGPDFSPPAEPAPLSTDEAAPEATIGGSTTEDAAKSRGSASESIHVEMHVPYDEARFLDEGVWLEELRQVVTWPWNIDALKELLSKEAVQLNPSLRYEVEYHLFHTISSNLDPKKPYIAYEMAAFLRDEFEWTRDGVGLARRMRYRVDFPFVLEAYRSSLRRGPPWWTRRDYLSHLAVRFAAFFASHLAFEYALSRQEDVREDGSYVAALVVTCGFVGLAYLLIGIAKVVLRWCGLFLLIRWALHKWAPSLYAKFDQVEFFGRTIHFLLACALFVYTFVITRI